MKRFVSLILSVCFLFSINTVSYAANISSRKASNPVIQSMNDKYHVDFSGMSIDELNKFIDKMKDEDQTRASGNLLNNTQLAWLAAAQIARDKGYECAALMVEFSVYNIDYSESVTDSSTPLLDKLNTTTVFNNYKNKVLNSGLKDFSGGSWSFTIQKSDNADLFYALHRVSTSGTGFMIGNSIMYYLITVHDTFDFAYDNNYDDLFTTTVNNWAWLCQQTHVLNPIVLLSKTQCTIRYCLDSVSLNFKCIIPFCFIGCQDVSFLLWSNCGQTTPTNDLSPPAKLHRAISIFTNRSCAFCLHELSIRRICQPCQ